MDNKRWTVTLLALCLVIAFGGGSVEAQNCDNPVINAARCDKDGDCHIKDSGLCRRLNPGAPIDCNDNDPNIKECQGGGASCTVVVPEIPFSQVYCSETPGVSCTFMVGSTESSVLPEGLALQITAVDREDHILVAAHAFSNRAIVILRFDPAAGQWTFIQAIDTSVIDPQGDGLSKAKLVFADLDNDGVDDLLAGSNPNAGSVGASLVVAFFDVDNVNETVPVVLDTPPGAGSFGRALAFGDVTGDVLPEIIVGAPDTNGSQGAVFVFDGSCPNAISDLCFEFLGSLDNPAPTGADLFGSSVAVGSSQGLFIGAQNADVGNNKKDAGKVYHFPEVLTDSENWVFLTRSERREGLGSGVAVADIINNDLEEELIAAPKASGGSLAVFNQQTEEVALETTPDYGLWQNLSAVSSGTSPSVVVSGTPNAPADTGNCHNTGAAFLYLDGHPTPIILRSPAPIDDNNLFSAGVPMPFRLLGILSFSSRKEGGTKISTVQGKARSMFLG